MRSGGQWRLREGRARLAGGADLGVQHAELGLFEGGEGARGLWAEPPTL